VNSKLTEFEQKEPYASVESLQNRIHSNSNPAIKEYLRNLIDLKAQREGLENSIKTLTKHIFISKQLVAESEMGTINTSISTSAITKQENVEDISGDTPFEQKIGDSFSYATGQKGQLDLDGYLRRPVSIYSGAVAVGSSLSLSISPWDLYTKVAAIRSKLRNFAYIRADLKVRVVFSGTPFHYGRVLVSYQPTPLANANLSNLVAEVAINANYRPLLLSYLSQAPGAATLDVKANKPIDINCPYISTKPMHRLFNDSASAIAAGTSFADMQYAGDVYIYTFNAVASINATSTPLYYQVYAWMENVDVGVPTATQMIITTEAKKGKVSESQREDVRGPVERFASRTKQVSDALLKVPSIAPFATATSMAAGTMEYIASLMGWSKPILNSLPMRVKNDPFLNGAQTIGNEMSKKICLDPYQETTIDPRSMAEEIDSMSISHICERPSYLAQFNWNDNSVPFTTLWTCAVTPSLTNYVVNATVSEVFSQPTPMAFASFPFKYWRGDITFRFEVVCSTFHRGKLAVFYEPNINQYTLINAGLTMHKQYMTVVDIQETQVFEVRVNWASYRAWLKTLTATAAYAALGNPGYSTYGNPFMNGYIGVIPFTELQSPDTSDIQVLVSVYSDNMKFNGLSNSQMPTARRLFAQSEMGFSPSGEAKTMELNESTATEDWVSEVHFGEQPASFRSLMKRFINTKKLAVGSGGSAAYNTLKVTLSIFPTSQCAYGDTSVNTWDMFSYLRYAYLGCRGSIRKRLRWVTNYTFNPSEHAKVSLAYSNTSQDTGTIVQGTTFYYAPYLQGTVTFIPRTNGGIEFELPMYTNNLHLQPALSNLVSTTDTGANETDFYRNYDVYYECNSAYQAGYMLEESASGEDFTFMRFQGAPFHTGGQVY